jgi:hypothetical protein
MGTLIFLAAIGSVCYVIGAMIYPFRACTLCKGSKRHRSPSRAFLRPCLKCGGSGLQTRMIVRIIRRVRPRSHTW